MQFKIPTKLKNSTFCCERTRIQKNLNKNPIVVFYTTIISDPRKLLHNSDEFPMNCFFVKTTQSKMNMYSQFFKKQD